MYEIGSPVKMEKEEVSGDYEIRRGQIYGFTLKARIGTGEFLSLGGEEGIAKKIWNNIEKLGDKPLYVRVSSEWNWLHFAYDVEIEAHIKHMGSSPGIATIIATITAFLIALTLFIYVSYYVFVEHKPPEFPEFGKEAIAILLLLILLIIIARRRS